MDQFSDQMLKGARQVGFWKWVFIPLWSLFAMPFTGYIYRQITVQYWGPEKYMPGAPMRKKYYIKKESIR